MDEEKPKRRKVWEHGTTGGYVNHKCRCRQCVKAWRIYNREYSRAYRARNVAQGLTVYGTVRKRPAKDGAS